jgi:hypothetical protein
MIINQTTSGPTNITINNNNLEQVENYKYLGSILNDKNSTITNNRRKQLKQRTVTYQTTQTYGIQRRNINKYLPQHNT